MESGFRTRKQAAEFMERQVLMNEKDAAGYLGWSVKTLQARRHYCKPPRYRKIGRSVRYVLADLEAFVEGCTVEPLA
jgi:predicted DNA-binding transcriptional regulator AlpA